MKAIWTKGLKTKAEKDKLKQTLIAARPQFDLLSEQINNKRKTISRNYNSPNWAQEQIAILEYNQALDDVLELLEIN